MASAANSTSRRKFLSGLAAIPAAAALASAPALATAIDNPDAELLDAWREYQAAMAFYDDAPDHLDDEAEMILRKAEARFFRGPRPKTPAGCAAYLRYSLPFMEVDGHLHSDIRQRSADDLHAILLRHLDDFDLSTRYVALALIALENQEASNAAI